MNYLSIKEASEKLGVHPDTLRTWDKCGYLIPEKTMGGHRRYLEEDLKELIEIYNNPISYFIRFNTYRPIPHIIKILGSYSVGNVVYKEGEEPGYCKIEAGEYRKTNNLKLDLRKPGMRRILLKDTTNDTGIFIEGKENEYCNYDIKEGCLYLSMIDIWREKKYVPHDNRKSKPPELLWGEEIKKTGDKLEIIRVFFEKVRTI